jgi:hypothetical protein
MLMVIFGAGASYDSLLFIQAAVKLETAQLA